MCRKQISPFITVSSDAAIDPHFIFADSTTVHSNANTPFD
jgi:hypothetical protein